MQVAFFKTDQQKASNGKFYTRAYYTDASGEEQKSVNIFDNKLAMEVSALVGQGMCEAQLSTNDKGFVNLNGVTALQPTQAPTAAPTPVVAPTPTPTPQLPSSAPGAASTGITASRDRSYFVQNALNNATSVVTTMIEKDMYQPQSIVEAVRMIHDAAHMNMQHLNGEQVIDYIKEQLEAVEQASA